MKVNLAVMFGGKSVEHEISVISALQALEHIDRDKYEVMPIYITKQGLMYTGKEVGKIDAYKNIDTLLKKSRQIVLTNDAGKTVVVDYPLKFRMGRKPPVVIDFVLPIVHGTNVEDGTLQGFLKTLGVPFAGCDVLSSAVGMDKHIMKLVFANAGIPVLNDRCYFKSTFSQDEERVVIDIENAFAYPVIVKPINLGSSIGIRKAADRSELIEALEFAFQFASSVLVERAITHLREINCAVLGDANEAVASECEEPLNATDILSYEDKYLCDGKSSGSSKGMVSLARKIPADITMEQRNTIQSMAVKAFQAIGGNGVARIDFMIDKDDGTIYLNEINTIPGSMSFYLWESSGISYSQLIEKLIKLGLKRAREEANIVFSFDTNVLNKCNIGGSKSGKLRK